jgi:hypothetical protein
MDQCRRLQGVPWSFLGELADGQTPKFLVQKLEELVGICLTAIFSSVQQYSCFAHSTP